MKNFDIIFKNGKTVTEDGLEDCDIAVTDGKICEIGKINAEAKIVEDVSKLTNFGAFIMFSHKGSFAWHIEHLDTIISWALTKVFSGINSIKVAVFFTLFSFGLPKSEI